MLSNLISSSSSSAAAAGSTTVKMLTLILLMMLVATPINSSPIVTSASSTSDNPDAVDPLGDAQLTDCDSRAESESESAATPLKDTATAAAVIPRWQQPCMDHEATNNKEQFAPSSPDEFDAALQIVIGETQTVARQLGVLASGISREYLQPNESFRNDAFMAMVAVQELTKLVASIHQSRHTKLDSIGTSSHTTAVVMSYVAANYENLAKLSTLIGAVAADPNSPRFDRVRRIDVALNETMCLLHAVAYVSGTPFASSTDDSSSSDDDEPAEMPQPRLIDAESAAELERLTAGVLSKNPSEARIVELEYFVAVKASEAAAALYGDLTRLGEIVRSVATTPAAAETETQRTQVDDESIAVSTSRSS